MEIRRTPPDELDPELVEGWDRLTDEPELRGVEAHRWPDGTWQVSVWVAEFLTRDPLESMLDQSMTNALRAVPGVSRVAHVDREMWEARGTADGLALIEAAASAIDLLAEDARPFVYGD